MIEILLLIVTLILAFLAVSGYDQYIATKIKARALRERSKLYPTGHAFAEGDPFTRMRIKKVKAAKVGSYLVVTLVISEEGRGGEKIEIEDPTLLLPLVNGENAEAVT
jgi:hypothetical protein